MALIKWASLKIDLSDFQKHFFVRICGKFILTFIVINALFQAGLVPSDNITVYYKASPDLDKIMTDFSDYIYSTIKQPLSPFPVLPGNKTIIHEATQVCFVRKTFFRVVQTVKI